MVTDQYGSSWPDSWITVRSGRLQDNGGGSLLREVLPHGGAAGGDVGTVCQQRRRHWKHDPPFRGATRHPELRELVRRLNRFLRCTLVSALTGSSEPRYAREWAGYDSPTLALALTPRNVFARPTNRGEGSPRSRAKLSPVLGPFVPTRESRTTHRYMPFDTGAWKLSRLPPRPSSMKLSAADRCAQPRILAGHTHPVDHESLYLCSERFTPACSTA